MYNTHYIKHVRDHVEVFDDCNNFMFSDDNEQEALHDLALMLAENERQKNKIAV